jgi:hypothetical protein
MVSPIADNNAVLLVMCMGLSFCFWDLHRSGFVNSNVACLFVYLVSYCSREELVVGELSDFEVSRV